MVCKATSTSLSITMAAGFPVDWARMVLWHFDYTRLIFIPRPVLESSYETADRSLKKNIGLTLAHFVCFLAANV